ncbi:hypothetical protein NUU61_007713 [Penicillium alfredii]|uniref:Uncharacterized protein n=1 Tax=Penicillium alfredii TaxID=1506179 RepID=A0A9W9ER49_9EURO|nr:uncharacterized protein NUU61_007713 [Penicillium alfredii]KAJ5086406.1 hypothetical protein NUU61_007713 [Penicillium alfredii]
MRCFSEYGGTNAGVWLRTCYDADKEEKHAALFKEFVTECEVVGPDGLVLDDHELFATDLAGMLELLPERVTSSAGAYHVTWREENLREIEEEEEEEEEEEREMEDDTQTAGDKKRREMLGPKKSEQKLVRNRYSIYHAACIVTHVFVEDEEALETGLVLHIYLDDCGNVVRQERVDATSVSNFDGLWFDGAWKESIIPGDGQVVGPAYLPGGVRGPPYR